MTKKKRYGLTIEAAAVCITVLCAAGACNGAAKEERTVHRVNATEATTTANTQPVESSTTSTSLTTTTAMTTTATTTTASQITTVAVYATTETTTEQITTEDATVLPTTTTTPATTTAPAPIEPYHRQTSGDYIYVNGFGWVFNEGGGGYGETNYDMYCNGNKIGYFG